MKKLVLLGLTVALMAWMPVALAQDVRIDSQRGMGDLKTPIAVPPFASTDPALADLAREMSVVVAYDLDFSGLFSLVPQQQYPVGFVGFSPNVEDIDLAAWKATPAENLVYGLIRREGNQLVGEFRLFDLASGSQLVGKRLFADEDVPRLLAHRFSEEVIRAIDGVAGIGTSEICFTAGTTGQKEIFIADYDGANSRQVTHHNSISIKPKMSPDGQYIAYLSYKDRYSYLYLFDRATGKSSPLSKEVGLNSAPSWAPNGEFLAMTLSKDGNTEIYLKNRDGSNPRRLTNNKSGDTSPTFSPDGSRIAFVSDRGGNPQIYVMNADGSNQQRLSYQGGSAFDPVWSPDGRYIAYAAERPGEGLEIYVMNVANSSSDYKRLTNSQGSNESPSWSADSRHIIFMSTRTGTARIYTVTPSTGEERLTEQLNMRCEGPSWGPRRP